MSRDPAVDRPTCARRDGALVLDDSTVGERGMVGANALVTEGTEIPPDTLATGTPAEVLREVEDFPWARG